MLSCVMSTSPEQLARRLRARSDARTAEARALREGVRAKLAAATAILRGAGADRVRLFGSLADADATTAEDVDLACSGMDARSPIKGRRTTTGSSIAASACALSHSSASTSTRTAYVAEPHGGELRPRPKLPPRSQDGEQAHGSCARKVRTGEEARKLSSSGAGGVPERARGRTDGSHGNVAEAHLSPAPHREQVRRVLGFEVEV